MTAGRFCPLHYRYSATTFAQAVPLEADVLYVVGGLYGNIEAWRTVAALFEQEPAACRHLVLNGDFHWFDVEPELFVQIEAATAPHLRLRGNVETEIASPSSGAGCGCAYPDEVDEATVARSNRILDRLRDTAQHHPAAVQRLAALPMTAVAQVGGQRIAVVHGDAESLAGWGFDPAALDDAKHQSTVAHWFAQAQVDVFASSHTCAAGLRRMKLMQGQGVVINNGAAGMPCFAGQRAGVISRVATTAAPAHLQCLYGTVLKGVHIDAVAVPYNASAWDERFLAMWPQGSDAHLSYWSRIQHGPRPSAVRPELVEGSRGSPRLRQAQPERWEV
ncbi:MAG: hypothetical protein ACKOF9_12730 [Burkholderiales bacterium]